MADTHVGAIAGKVFISTGGGFIPFTPDGARRAAAELRRMADIAERLCGEPPSVDEMDAMLQSAGWRWRWKGADAELGYWHGQDAAGVRRFVFGNRATATRHAHELLAGQSAA